MLTPTGAGRTTPREVAANMTTKQRTGAIPRKGRDGMKTAGIFSEVFTERTTGKRATFTVNALTIDAVKVVLNGIIAKVGTDGAEDDERAGYVRKVTNSGYYGGADGYKPTAKGYREILKALKH